MNTLAIDLVTDAAALPALAADWDALWRRAHGASPFQSPAWLLPWWQVFGSRRPVIAVLHDGAGLAGLLPLYLLDEAGRRKLLPIGAGISDYLDALLAPDAPPDAMTRLLAAALDGAGEAGAVVCDLIDVPTDGVLPQAGLPTEWCGAWRRAQPCPVLTLPPDARDVADAVPHALRRKLRMNRHRADRAGGWSVRTDATADTLDRLLWLHARRWNGIDPAVARFHHAAAPGLLDAGLLRLGTLEIGGMPAACCYALVDRADRLLLYMLGFDPAFAACSPGSLLIAGMINAAIAEGRRQIHFLRGNEAYKYAWGARDRFNQACRMEPVP